MRMSSVLRPVILLSPLIMKYNMNAMTKMNGAPMTRNPQPVILPTISLYSTFQLSSVDERPLKKYSERARLATALMQNEPNMMRVHFQSSEL